MSSIMTFGHVVCEIDKFTETTTLTIRDGHGRMTEHTTKLDRFVLHLIGASIMAKADGGPPVYVCEGDTLLRIEDYEFLSCLLKIMEEQDMRANLMRVSRLSSKLREVMGKGEKLGTKILTSDIEELIEAADKRRDEVVLCLLGAPGIGKTEGIEAFAKRHDRNVVHIIASQILPTEVSGMTMPNQETHSMDVFDHARLGHLRDGDVLFFDELLKGQVQVLNACLTLIQERRMMSGRRLPDVLIVAAANPLASPQQLPLEVRQRFMFVEVQFDEDSWCDYMRGLGIARPQRLVDDLVTDSSSAKATWNVLTPRTMTKLMLWLKECPDSEVVERYVKHEFGAGVYERMRQALAKSDATRADSPMRQVADEVARIMQAKREEALRSDDIRKMDACEDAIRRVNEAAEGDRSSLLDIISQLPEGEEILRELSSKTIELPTF